MADTSVKLSGTYDSIEAYNIMVEMQNMSADYEEIRTEAAAAASAATAAVTTAQTAANSASTYAGNAQTYAGNANTSAGEAAGYASDASTSASNAATSETNASNSASAAATSAADAAASEAVVAGALPLSGGTMTGNIAFNGANGRKFKLESTNDGKNFNVGWDAGSSDGAFLGFRSSDFTNREGEFYLSAKNSSTEVALIGNTSGSLTWATKEVVTKKDEDISSSVSFTTNNGTITGKKVHKVGNMVQGTFTIKTASAVSIGGTITGSISGLPAGVGNMNTSGVTFYGGSVIILALGSTSYSVRVNASQLAANVEVVLPFTYATVS